MGHKLLSTSCHSKPVVSLRWGTFKDLTHSTKLLCRELLSMQQIKKNPASKIFVVRDISTSFWFAKRWMESRLRDVWNMCPSAITGGGFTCDPTSICHNLLTFQYIKMNWAVRCFFNSIDLEQVWSTSTSSSKFFKCDLLYYSLPNGRVWGSGK